MGKLRVLLTLFVALCLSTWAQGKGLPTIAQGAQRAGVVVVHGDGRVATGCVAFDEPQLTGLELLRRSGLDLNVESLRHGRCDLPD